MDRLRRRFCMVDTAASLTGCAMLPQPPRNRCRRNCATNAQPPLQLRRNRPETTPRTKRNRRNRPLKRGRCGCAVTIVRFYLLENPMTAKPAFSDRAALRDRLVAMRAELVDRMMRAGIADGSLALLAGFCAAIKACGTAPYILGE